MNIVYDKNYIIAEDSILELKAISRNQKLVYVDEGLIETKKSIGFIFKYLSYAILAIFVIAIRHKTMWLELVTSCQIIYISYAFYKQPSFLSSSLQNL